MQVRELMPLLKNVIQSGKINNLVQNDQSL